MNYPSDKRIILFDGVCNLCNSSVQFIIKRDTKDVFRFVALQSEIGREIIDFLGIDTKITDSIILYEPNRAYYVKAEAALRIAKELTGLYKFLFVFNYLPAIIKDTLYDFIAKNRYKWYGKNESCMIPTPELKQKFL